MPDFLSFGFSKPGLIAATLAALFLMERVWPAVKGKTGRARLLKNFSLALLNVIASPLIIIPLTAMVAGLAPQWRPASWSGWPALTIDLLLLDFWIYLWHRANHMLPLLWRFHVVHHLDETLDASTGLRFHVGEVILSSLVRAAVIFALNIPLRTVIVFETAIAVAALFQHSNLKLPIAIETVLSKIIVTPSLHWIHHHAMRADTDSNYATVLSLWDVLFRTRSKTRRTRELAMGVENMADRSFWALLLTPFLPRR